MQMSKFFELAIIDSMTDGWNFRNSESNYYPPHNVLKLSDDSFALEFAVAGFKQEELEVLLDKNSLVISGKKKSDDESQITDISYHYKGISTRSFKKSFQLEKYLEVTNVSLSDGILKILLERIVPEEEKPKILTIS